MKFNAFLGNQPETYTAYLK